PGRRGAGGPRRRGNQVMDPVEMTEVTEVMQATLPAAGRSKRSPMRSNIRHCAPGARGLAIVCGLLGACTAYSSDVLPPETELYFPTGLVVAPDESVAFVANANSELRYDSGAITVLDLQEVDDAIAAWTQAGEIPTGDSDGDGEADCAQDLDRSET